MCGVVEALELDYSEKTTRAEQASCAECLKVLTEMFERMSDD
jgi:hypothetical protein